MSCPGLGPFDHAAAAPAAATPARRGAALADAAGARGTGAGAAVAAEAPQRGGAGCGGGETWLGRWDGVMGSFKPKKRKKVDGKGFLGGLMMTLWYF